MICGYSDDCAGRFDFESDDDDDAVTFSGNNVVHVWDGWDSALIVSKHENVKQGVTPDSYDEKVQEEDGSRELTVNECKRRDSCGKKVKLHHLPDVLWAVSDLFNLLQKHTDTFMSCIHNLYSLLTPRQNHFQKCILVYYWSYLIR
ncbi:unnamed protein product [Camellia sinensis]